MPPSQAIIRAVLFDLDGTLLDSLPLFVETYSRALGKSGLSIPAREIPFKCFGKTELEICAALGRPELARELSGNYFSEIRGFLIPRAGPVPGAPETLEFLAGKGVKIALVSFAYNWYIEEIFARLGIGKFFSAVVGRSDVLNQKPAPDPALLACRKLGVSPAQALVVGDTVSDILMGKAAGCRTALYFPEEYSRFFRKEESLAAGPDLVLQSLPELREELRELLP